jgi:hypothetical protein
MSHSKASPQRLLAAQRRTEAVRLRVAGKTYEFIGETLGISTVRAYQFVTEELQRLGKERAEAAAELTQIELQRLEALHACLWKRAVDDGDLDAIDRLVRIANRRAKLLGLDKPTQQHITGDPAALAALAQQHEQTRQILADPGQTHPRFYR